MLPYCDNFLDLLRNKNHLFQTNAEALMLSSETHTHTHIFLLQYNKLFQFLHTHTHASTNNCFIQLHHMIAEKIDLVMSHQRCQVVSAWDVLYAGIQLLGCRHFVRPQVKTRFLEFVKELHCTDHNSFADKMDRSEKEDHRMKTHKVIYFLLDFARI